MYTIRVTEGIDMKYSDLVGVEPFFDSTFNITEEKEGYWKSFITNDKFENNLASVINAFDSETINNRKSIWIQGTYGTGKSHSTSVIKHVLSDDFDEISDFVCRLKNPQLRGRIIKFRSERRVFPIVLKGTNEIVDVEEMKYVVQKAVIRQLSDAGIDLTVKSDFDAVLSMVSDKRFASYWAEELNGELKRYAASVQEIEKLLLNGDVDLLKEINTSLKKSSMMKATDNIVKWLTEVARELRHKKIASNLVIFWDEFTSLLDITERRSILNTIQDIAELSKAPDPERKDELVGVYVFLVTHKNLEAMDSYKELKEDEKTMAKSRFVELQYDMQDRTTYHILSNAIKVKNEAKDNELIAERIDANISIQDTLERMTEQLDKPTETKGLIKKLYPFHPYTAYLATFVSRAIGSAERSIFEFLNDEEKGFKKFIEGNIDSIKFLTADYVWDFFAEAFSDDRTNDFTSIISKFKLYENIIRSKGEDYSVVFKVILLLNLLNKVIASGSEYQERSLVVPSDKNIKACLSGRFTSERIQEVLGYIDDNQIIIKSPEGIYEVASSAIPIEKVQEVKKRLYSDYEDPSKIFDEYPGVLMDLKKEFTKVIFRMTKIEPMWAGMASFATLESKIVKKFDKDLFALQIALFVSRGETKECDRILNRSELSISSQKTSIETISSKPTFSNIAFVILDTSLGKNGFEGYVDSRAREKVATDLGLPSEVQSYREKAEKWIIQWKNSILSSGKCTLIFRGQAIDTTVANIGKTVKTKVEPVIFNKGLELIPEIGSAKTAWPDQVNAKTVENICFATTRSEIESKMTQVAAVVKYLLKDTVGNYIFDEKMEYVGTYNANNPFEMLMKAVDEKIESLRTRSIVDLGSELSFLAIPGYGYYSNCVCMAAVALVLHKYIDKIYRADKGTIVDRVAMKDIVVALFNYWRRGKSEACLKVRFSTEEEKELVEQLQDLFKVQGDGIANTKWNLRKKFDTDYKAPLWVLKYVTNNGEEFNKIIDSLFAMSITPNDSIKQDDISQLLTGIKLNKTELTLALSKVKDSDSLLFYVNHILTGFGNYGIQVNDLLEFLNQQMQDNVVFWDEKDVYVKILEYCNYQKKQDPDISEKQPISDIVVEDIPISDVENLTIDDSEESTQPEFDPVDLTPIGIVGKIHATIEEAQCKIEAANLSESRAKKLLVSLCTEYPVICDKLIKLLDEEWFYDC